MPRVKSTPRYKGPTPFEVAMEEYLSDPLRFGLRPVRPKKTPSLTGKGTKEDPFMFLDENDM